MAARRKKDLGEIMEETKAQDSTTSARKVLEDKLRSAKKFHEQSLLRIRAALVSEDLAEMRSASKRTKTLVTAIGEVLD